MDQRTASGSLEANLKIESTEEGGLQKRKLPARAPGVSV
jgi:hypothetical protein